MVVWRCILLTKHAGLVQCSKKPASCVDEYDDRYRDAYKKYSHVYNNCKLRILCKGPLCVKYERWPSTHNTESILLCQNRGMLINTLKQKTLAIVLGIEPDLLRAYSGWHTARYRQTAKATVSHVLHSIHVLISIVLNALYSSHKPTSGELNRFRSMKASGRIDIHIAISDRARAPSPVNADFSTCSTLWCRPRRLSTARFRIFPSTPNTHKAGIIFISSRFLISV